MPQMLLWFLAVSVATDAVLFTVAWREQYIYPRCPEFTCRDNNTKRMNATTGWCHRHKGFFPTEAADLG